MSSRPGTLVSGRFVALKFLRRDDPDQIKRFTREAKIQAMVEHENLCPVYEVGEIDGHSFIAMQYIAGGSIKEVADLLDTAQKVQVMVDVADALHTAHQAGLIHRDIKPANILVERNSDGSWHPYVVDFGIAREVDTPHDLTVTGMVLGTPAFSSPEQVRGEIEHARPAHRHLWHRRHPLLVPHRPVAIRRRLPGDHLGGGGP